MARGITPLVPGLTLGASAHDPDHRHRRTPPAPEQVESLLIKPVLAASVALNPLCSRVLRPTAPSVRLPAVTADPTAACVAEGAEIPVSDLATAEVDVVTKKVAGLSVVTSELAEDSSPEATAEVGRGLARDIARKVDAAFFGDGTAQGGEQPDGLAAPTDLDAFAEAQMLAANVGAQLTAFVTSRATALVLANMKEATGSGKPPLQPDPTQPTRSRMIFGVPLLNSPEAPVGTVWGLPADRLVTAVRHDAEVKADRSVFFTSDRVAVRATCRVGFGFPHTAALVRIRLTAS
ncbi:phage major capsid protein [Geodermatophilus sp. SYSU D01176]